MLYYFSATVLQNVRLENLLYNTLEFYKMLFLTFRISVISCKKNDEQKGTFNKEQHIEDC